MHESCRMNSASPQAPGLLKKILATLLSIVLLIVGVMFSAVVLVVLAVLGLAAWGYFYWKTRKLRQAMQESLRDTDIIEGEATVVHDVFEHSEPRLASPSSPPRSN